MLQELPLVLEFNGTVAQTHFPALAKWMVAGLAEIELVRRHEAKQVPACADLNCPRCPHKRLVRTLSPGWKKLAGHSPSDRETALAREARQKEAEKQTLQDGPDVALELAEKHAASLRDELARLQAEMGEKQRQLLEQEKKINEMRGGVDPT